MTTDSQTSTLHDSVVADPSVVLKETSRTLKQLIEAQTDLPDEIVREARNEIAEFERNYDELLSSDFDDAHQNMKELVKTATKTLRDVLVLAGSYDSPSGYEVVAMFLKIVADLNKDMLELHDKRENVKAKMNKTASSGSGNITNNNVFVGSTADALKLLRQARDGKVDGLPQP